METSKFIKNISIRNTMIIVFLLAMMLSIIIIGSVVFSNWFGSAKETTERTAVNMNEILYEKISSFLQGPKHINDVNYTMIQNGIIDLTNEKQRDRFFVSVLNAHDEKIYSFSFGTANGEYFGARRNENGVVEIMRNNADTGGNSWYYSVNEDWTAGELVVQGGKFDPRTREWYKSAVETGGPAFSPLYKHFIMDDLSLSAGMPIFDKDGGLLGVLGAHMLLTDLGDYLEDTVRPYNGYSIVVEKQTGALVANSMGMVNFDILPDGTVERYHIGDIDNSEAPRAYEQFLADQTPQFLYKGEKENHYINIKEINMGGLDWVILSAIPEDLLLSYVVANIQLAILLAAATLLLSFVLYFVVTKKLTKPMYQLLQAIEAFASGDLSQRAPIIKNDEIARISASFNKVANKMGNIIDNLETTVEMRTEELYATMETMKENKDRLQLILDSASEGIYGNDTEGNCTFCNISCIQMLGYSKQEDLLGKNMHELMHHSKPDGKRFPVNECSILQSIKEGKGVHVDDEVFWKADGTSFRVEYRSYPQIKNGEIIGAVITYTDITQRKAREEKINYLSYHDTLTGVYNRHYFVENLSKGNDAENLPFSVIFADINNLKMTNDIFGHTAGDALIKRFSEILVQSCRQNDIIARVGGDEFIILLPRTDKEEVKRILARIKNDCSKAQVAAIRCSVSIGADTKTTEEQSIEDIITNAENAMYKDKLTKSKELCKGVIENIIHTLHSESLREKQHSEVVSELCADIGKALRMNDRELNGLKEAGYLHDIGKIVLDSHLLIKDNLDQEDLEKFKQHPIVGYRILKLFDETLDLAEYVYYHHERWDGKGYPKGLKGEEIPQISRIISIAETYERVLAKETAAENSYSHGIAIQVIKDGAGTLFDPGIAELFVEMIEEKES